MNILITSAGRRVSLVRSFQKELKKINPEAKVFASDSEPILSAACHVADAYFKVSRLSDPNYIDDLIDLCKKRGIRLIIPTIDTELALLAQNKYRFEKNKITVIVAETGFIEKCRDKRLIHRFFESNGLKVAKEYAKDNYKLPLFIKPANGSRSIDTYIIKSEDGLNDYHFTNDNLMFLEYLDHDQYDEFTCDLYYGKDNSLKCVVPRKRIEVRDGEVYKSLVVNNELVPMIKEHLGHIDGAIGCLTSQFFKHKTAKKIYAIEINARFGGGYPLSYLAGANYPKWILEEYILGKDIKESFDCWESDLLMIRYDDEILVHGYKS